MKRYNLQLKIIMGVFFICFWGVGSLFAAEDYLSIFKNAEKSYEAGEYSKAIDSYEALISKGQRNTALYYNLGNAYYKTGKIGKAILNYERAKRLSPQDSGIRSNIIFLKKFLQENEQAFFESIMEWVRDLMPIDFAALAASFFFILLIFGIILRIFTNLKYIIVANIILTALLLFFISIFALQYSDQILTKWAVAVSTSEARNGPGPDNSTEFSIPEGKKVIILGEEGDWYAIGLKIEGLKGWVEKKNIEAI